MFAPILVISGALWVVCFGRWGSFLGLPAANIYLPDVLTLTGIVAMTSPAMRAHPRRSPSSPVVVALTAAILAYAAMRIMWSHNPLYLELRDSAPLFYLAVAPCFAAALRIIGPTRAARLLRGACSVHLAWALPACLGFLPQLQLIPSFFSAERQFGMRSDVDSVILVVTIVIAATGAGRRSTARTEDFVLGAGATVAQLSQYSRAAFVALVVTAVVLLVMYRPWRQHLGKLLFATWLLITSLTLVVAIQASAPQLLAHSEIASRAGLGAGDRAAKLQGEANATSEARKHAWSLLWTYSNANTSRQVIGSGPGSDMMRRSGALYYLSGDPKVRAPHSWLLGAYARFGLIGVVLWVLLSLAIVRPRRAGEVMCRPPGGRGAHHESAPWTAISVGFLATSCFGVVMEAPFGALAFSIGIAGVGAFRAYSPRPSGGVSASPDEIAARVVSPRRPIAVLSVR